MNKKVIWIAGIVFVLSYIITQFSELYVDYNWFDANKGPGTFWTLTMTKVNVHILFSFFFIILFGINFLLIKVLGGNNRIFTSNIIDRLHFPHLGSPRKIFFISLIIIIFIVSMIMGNFAASYWQEYLLFKHAVPFAQSNLPLDPIFGMDIGFYVFDLPFYNMIYHWLLTAFVVLTVISLFFHVINGGIILGEGKIELSLFSRAHISTLLALIVVIFGFGYKLASYDLLLSQSGKIFGATYIAVHSKLFAYRVAMTLSFIASLFFLINIFKKSFRLPMVVLAILLPLYFILGTIYPALQQKFLVEPNELSLEKPFIQNHITYTRLAYDIDRVKEIPFENNKNLTYKDIVKNKDTLENIRIWDWRPLKPTFNQLQGLRPYYHFKDIDIDRYLINDKKIAVNLSARELDKSKLSQKSRTWQNTNLMFTHGYGAVLSRVDKISPEGLPEFLIYDIPSKSKLNINITKPQIYYGELEYYQSPYIITNTTIKPGEFDYPSGDRDNYTTYDGKGGIQLDSILKKLMYAIHFSDMNILISGEITDQSRIHYNTRIQRMVRKFTPFLEFDNDPYLVISKGKLYWIYDAYTTTYNFPYSSPGYLSESNSRMLSKRINYIRNSVKIIIDAYNGTMDYYIADTNDPLIKCYANIFPGIFKSLDKMPRELRQHLRYPEMIFNLQSRKLLRYHISDPTVFYRDNDAWGIPNQLYHNTGASADTIKGTYLVTKLPDETDSEFILMIPFTPYKKENMIAFLTAKCDTANYGELKLYVLPKEKMSYGPQLIESKINQDPEITKLLTLWNQEGSRVIRGNMLVLPIEQSILYIEPLFLRAEKSEMPELKRVIVFFADKIVMDKDLPSALVKLFGEHIVETETIHSNDRQLPVQTRVRELAQKAYSHYTRANSYLKQGNWQKYGEELKLLEKTLITMKNLR